MYIAYRDESESKYYMSHDGTGSNLSNAGFKTIYKRKDGGRRFTELLDKVSLINPEVKKKAFYRIRSNVYRNTKDLIIYRCVFDSLHLILKISLQTCFI